MKLLNKILITTSLTPIAVLPAMVSCNHPLADEYHLIKWYDVGSGEGLYMTEWKSKHLPSEQKATYKAGTHQFVIEVNSDQPVDDFWMYSDDHETQVIDTNNWTITANGKDIKNQWKVVSGGNHLTLKEDEEPITASPIVITLTLTQDLECSVYANFD